MNINFNNPYRYYFTHLGEVKKKIYSELLSGLTNFDDKIPIPYADINTVSEIFKFVLLDNPLVHYAPTFTHWSDSNNEICTIEPKYKYSKSISKRWHNDIIRYLLKFDTVCNKSEYKKELFVHEYCLNNFCYDYSFDEKSHTIMGPILENRAVCEGIAKFVKLVFDYVGLKSIVVTGDAENPDNSQMEGHAWNIVEVEGELYHLDVTFDMTLTSDRSAHRYDYFNLPDNDILVDHVIGVSTPKCNAVSSNYFHVNSMYIDSLEKLKGYAGNSIRRGERRIYFKLAQENKSMNLSEKAMKIVGDEYMAIKNSGYSITMSSRPEQMVFEITFR